MRRTMPARGLVAWAVVTAALTIGAAVATAAPRAWLGVYTQRVTDELRDGLDLRDGGVLVNGVVDGSPADRAGLRKGDVIVSFNSRAVSSPDALTDMVADAGDGRTVAIGISRHGDRSTISVKLGQRPSDDDLDNAPDAPEAPTPPSPPEAPEAPRAPKAPHVMRWYSSDDNDKGVDPDQIREQVRRSMDGFELNSPDGSLPMRFVYATGRGRLGVRVEALNDDLASALGAPSTHGVVVMEVLKDTPAEKAGLKAGDVITAVEGHSIDDASDLVKTLRDQKGSVSLSIVRRGDRRTVQAELRDEPTIMRLRDRQGPMGMGRMGDDDGTPRARVRANDDDREEMRKQIDELREQLRELRQKLEDEHHN